VASDNQSITMNTNEVLGDNDDTRFFTEVHLLAGKLVPAVAIHSLGGSHANRHHMPNLQSSAAQPTQDGDHTSHEQSTRVSFGSPREKIKNTSQSPRSEPEISTDAALSLIHSGLQRSSCQHTSPPDRTQALHVRSVSLFIIRS
jgi:hypothetical protein